MNSSTVRKLLVSALALMLVICALPMTLAESIGYELKEAAFMAQTDRAWDAISAYEAELDAKGLAPEELTNKVYEFVSNRSDVVSITWEDSKSCLFSFVLENGCHCAYDYELNHLTESYEPSLEALELVEKGTTSGQDVLLLGPYYGLDGSFTDQYMNEANTLAEFMGGTATVYGGYDCDGNSCKTLDEYGIVIFDSHGNKIGSNSYLCLNSSNGISSEDYTSGRAINAGGWYGVTGTFFQHYNDTLPNSLIWMAICLGMATDTLCDPLLADGAGAVFGYTESVTFRYDYEMEGTFFDCLTGEYDGQYGDYGVFYNVGDAAEIAIAEHGTADPYSSDRAALRWKGDLEWVLAEMGPVAATDVEISPDPIHVNEHNAIDVRALTTPRYANDYTLEWSTDDESIATVDSNGRVFGVYEGTTTITVELYDNITGETYTDTATLVVDDYPSVEEAITEPDSGLFFGNDVSYPWSVATSATGRVYAASTNSGEADTTSAISLTLNMQAGETLSFEWSVSSKINDDYLYFNVNGETINRISGTSGWRSVEYVAQTSGIHEFTWEYTKNAESDGGGDRGMIDSVAYSGVVEHEYVTVTYVDGYTGNTIDTGTVMLGVTITQFPTVPEHDGVVFVGWDYNGAPVTDDIIVTAEYRIIGDMDGNGEVTAIDALAVLRIALGSVDHDEIDALIGDYDNNGQINAMDALAILRDSLN